MGARTRRYLRAHDALRRSVNRCASSARATVVAVRRSVRITPHKRLQYRSPRVLALRQTSNLTASEDAAEHMNANLHFRASAVNLHRAGDRHLNSVSCAYQAK